MIKPDEALDIFGRYDRDDITVATLGSHTALQILKGAKEEGFRTMAICKRGREVIYERFGVADRIVTLDSYTDMLSQDVLDDLRAENAVMVPHGSLVAYVGVKNIEDRLEVPILGNRGIMRWESDRTLERKWLEEAGIKMPRETKDPRNINSLSLVKFPGAKGGRGYFIVNNYGDFEKKARYMLKKKRITQKDIENATIQEYISGVNMYLSYFYSAVKEEVELFGIDRRYEANIDGIARIPANDQVLSHIEPSYVVVGNAPLVARESLLARIFEMGDRLVEVSKKIAPPGMFGPFCLETMVNEHLEFIAFEISARIVAGTNPFMDGSPYSYLQYGPNMSMGRRIAVELKEALEEDKQDLLLS